MAWIFYAIEIKKIKFVDIYCLNNKLSIESTRQYLTQSFHSKSIPSRNGLANLFSILFIGFSLFLFLFIHLFIYFSLLF